MKLKIKSLKFIAGRPVAILNHKTAEKLNLHINNRVLIKKDKEDIIAVIDIAKGFVEKNEIAVSQEILKDLKAKQGDKVEIEISLRPRSVDLIHKKFDCHPLDKKELRKIIQDVVANALTEVEVAYFISAIYKCGMSIKEIGYLIDAIVKTS